MIRSGTARRDWLAWSVICLAVFILQAATVEFYPALYQDEVQILDIGRTVLDTDSQWAMSWDAATRQPIVPVSYLGPVLQELAYLVTEPSHVGGRILSLLSLLLAASCAFGWLRARSTPPTIALVLAAALLLDPLVNWHVRVGRVDCWVFASCLAACWLLRSTTQAGVTARQFKLRLLAAGALLAAAPFFWPTATMLLPLVLLELYYALQWRQRTSNSSALTVWLQAPLVFGLGGAAMLALLCLPVLLHWQVYLDGLRAVADVQVHAAAIQNPLLNLALVHDPAITVLAALSLFYRRETGLLIMLLLAAMSMYLTMVYAARVMYLIPYLLAMIAGAATVVWAGNGAPRSRSLWQAGLALMLLWNAGTVLLFRTYTAVQQATSYAPEVLLPGLQRAVGAGSHRVLADEWHVYFAGRQLGWQMIRPGAPLDKTGYATLLRTMDYVIVNQVPYNETTLNLVKELGFELKQTLEFPQSPARDVNLGLLQWHMVAGGYPSLLVYQNPQHRLRDQATDSR